MCLCSSVPVALLVTALWSLIPVEYTSGEKVEGALSSVAAVHPRLVVELARSHCPGRCAHAIV